MIHRLAVPALLVSLAAPAWATEPSCLAFERGDGGTPVIRAYVGDAGPFPFIMDTAASGTSIVEAVAARLNLPRDAETETAQGMGGAMDIHVYRIARFTAGPASVAGQLAAGIPDFGFDSHAIAGLAGVDLFEDRLTIWRPDRGCVSVLPGGGEPDGPGWTRVEAVWTRPWKIMLPVRIAGVDGWGLLDTGAQHTVLNPVFAARLGLTADAAGVRPGGEIYGIDGRALPLLEADATDVSIGAWSWPERTLKVGALPVFDRLGEADAPLAIIGIDWLGDRGFAVDYRSQRVWVRAPP